MFINLVIGITLLASLVLLVLLVQPRPNEDLTARSLPLVVLVVVSLMGTLMWMTNAA